MTVQRTPPRARSPADLAAWATTIAAIVLDRPGDVRSAATAGTSLAALSMTGRRKPDRDDQLGALQQRVDELQSRNVRARIVRGDRLALLRLCLLREAGRLWAWLMAEDAELTLGWDSRRYAAAARELAALGLVRIEQNGRGPGGVASTPLAPPA